MRRKGRGYLVAAGFGGDIEARLETAGFFDQALNESFGPCPNQFNQLFIHEFVFIWYFKNVEPFVIKLLSKFADQTGLMFFFHRENHVCPANVINPNTPPCVTACAC